MQCDAFQSYKYFAVDKKYKAKSRKQTCRVPCCVHTFAANAPASIKGKELSNKSFSTRSHHNSAMNLSNEEPHFEINFCLRVPTSGTASS